MKNLFLAATMVAAVASFGMVAVAQDIDLPELQQVESKAPEAPANAAKQVASNKSRSGVARAAAGSYRADSCKRGSDQVFRSDGPVARRGPLRRLASNVRARRLEVAANRRLFSRRAERVLGRMCARGAY